jgi:putative nucleotidyltransferase-like protein
MDQQSGVVHLPPAIAPALHGRSAVDAVARSLVGHALTPDDLTRANELVEVAIAHGVAGLMSSAAAAMTGSAAERLAAYRRSQQLLSKVRDQELRRVCAALHERGISALVVKGAHLAHAIYPESWLRPRSDNDLFISSVDRQRVAEFLTTMGYAPLAHTRGTVILGQFHFHRRDEFGVAHVLDVHWRAAAPLVLDCDALRMERLAASAAELPALAPGRGPTRADALLLACIHLAAHHRDDGILLWLFDIHLLARALDAGSRQAFIAAAADARVTALCVFALDRSARVFPDETVADLSARLRLRSPLQPELSARLLTTRRRIDGVWLDLVSAGSWRTRATLLREHLLPDPEYMHDRPAPPRLLPLAYAARALHGVRKWIASSGGDR